MSIFQAFKTANLVKSLLFTTRSYPKTVKLLISPMAVRQFSSNDFSVIHDTENQKFVIDLDAGAKAFLEYEKLTDNEVLLYHTEVPSNFGGRGIGKILAEKAFNHFESNGNKLVITCTYLQKYDKNRKAQSTK